MTCLFLRWYNIDNICMQSMLLGVSGHRDLLKERVQFIGRIKGPDLLIG